MKTKLTNYGALLFAVLWMNTEKTTAQTYPTNMSWIPPGNFVMGDTFGEGDSDELPLHSVYVSAFYMDKYEVTKTLWDEVYNWAITNGYGFDHNGSGKAVMHSVQEVNWYDCVKWCNARSEKELRAPAYYTSATQTNVYRTGQLDVQNSWVKWDAGYRLPTEAEREKAARGGLDGHRFPWGNVETITHSQANYYSSSNYNYDTSPTRGNHPTFNDGVQPYTSPVSYFAPNGYGLYDMTGNVWEWCWDWYGAYSSGSQTNPPGPASGSSRMLRGAAFHSDAYRCRTAYRRLINPTFWANSVGFRLVL